MLGSDFVNNIFVVGSEVRGESQIGYIRYIDKFTQILLNTINNISITGLKRFGKTSLVKEVLERVKASSGEKVITIFVDLAKQRSFSDLLVSILNILEDETIEDEEINGNKIFNKYMEKANKVDQESKTYRDTFDSIFKWLTKQGYRIIIVIDEFDAASELFKETADFEFLRDLSSNRDIRVSLVLISRRQLYMIEKKNFNNSTFHGVVQTYPIDGFNDEDFELFYKLLKDKYDIILRDYAIERLKYYCGRSPYLISMFAYDIVDEYLKNGEYNIDVIYRNREIDIENYYKSIFACLKNDKISVDGAYEETCSIEKLIGVIIGPKVGIVNGDITLLENMGYLYVEDNLYCSISQHFTNALHQIPLSVDTWKSILELEKKVKTMVRKQIMINYHIEYIDYDTWTDIFNKIGAVGTLGTYDKFIADSMQEYRCDIDILDVCSLDIAVSIVQFFWERWFSKFFDNDEWEKWEQKLRICASARNPMAHGHEEFLSSEDKLLVNEYCDSIIKILSKGNACVNINTELKLEDNIRKAEARKTYYDLVYSDADEQFISEKVMFTAADQNNKGIVGFFNLQGKNYKCTLGKNKWKTKYDNIPLSKHLGKEFKIKLVGINQNLWIVELV